jgi:N-acetyl-anhydromuramyl-L-alanine amidase AmpD
MPTQIQVMNRYVPGDPVVGAAITFDHDNEDAKTPRTAANGFVTVSTEGLSDGNHVVRITPRYTSDLQVGPDIAEDLAVSVTRMFRSLEVGITVLKGKVQAVNSLPGQQSRGTVAAGTNPVRVLLQPMYHRSPHQNPNFRTHEKITLIVVHQTAGSTNIGGTLTWFENQQANPNDNVSSNYVISAEANPQVVKVVQDTSRAWHAGGPGQTWWGEADVNNFAIGIELSHKAKTPWPDAQIGALIGLLEMLLNAYPSIKRHRIVGHTDVLLIDRDCPGLEFDWAALEKFGLGMVPNGGAISLDDAYGGFFRLRPTGHLRKNDRDTLRVWGGGNPWPASPAVAGAGGAVIDTVSGNPIRELQTDLQDIGYFAPSDGNFDARTEFAVMMFQKHFFSGSRRTLIHASDRGKVDQVTAEFIKRVRP